MIIKLAHNAPADAIFNLDLPIEIFALISCWVGGYDETPTFADLHSAIDCANSGEWSHAGAYLTALPDGSIEVYDGNTGYDAGSVRYVATRRDRNTVDINTVDIGWGEGPFVNRVTVKLLDDGGLESSGIMDWGAITDDDGEALAKWIELGSGDEFAWDGPVV